MRLNVVVLAALLLIVCETMFGQAVTGTLVGNVLDPSGAPVSGSRILVTEVSTGFSRSTLSGKNGSWSIPYLPPGSWRVEIEAGGFKLWREPAVLVGVDTTVRVDAQLTLGARSDVVDVHDESTGLESDRADVSRSFDHRQTTELPLITQNIYDLAALIAGIAPTSSVSTTLQNPMNGRSFQANGQSGSANNEQIDGVDNNEPLIGVTIEVPPAEGVREVSFTTGNYSAELGRAGGAVVNVISQSGSNQFHGSAWEFHQDDGLEARNFFNVAPQQKPFTLSNKYGGTIGGPVIRDKTFFFVSYQGSLQDSAANTSGSVPVQAWREGNFSGVPGLTIYNPFTGNADGTGRTPFPNNTIPSSLISPVASNILPSLYQPDLSGLSGNLNANVPSWVKGNQVGSRLDEALTSRTQFFAKYDTSLWNTNNEAILGPTLGSSAGSHVFTQTASVNVTEVFSSTLLSENRFGYNRYRTNVSGLNTANLNQQFGIGDPNPTSLSTSGLADIVIGGMPAIGLSVVYPIINTDNIFNPSSSWTKIAGRHTLKFGADLRRLRLDRNQATGLSLGPRGLFDFNTGTTALKGGPSLGPYGTLGNSFASFLLGTPDILGRTYLTVTPTNRQWEEFDYVNDTWQVNSRLTLNLGLRWEMYTPIVPAHPGGASNYDPANNSLLVAGIGGVGMSTGVKTDWSNWAPRFGFAWRPASNLVVRGGYGISYFTGIDGFTGGTLSTQFPVVGNVQIGNSGTYVAAGNFNSIPAIPTIPIPASGIIQPAPNQALYYVPFVNRNPYVQSYNLVIQRVLWAGFIADAGYVGNLGRRLANDWGMNQAAPGTGTAGLLLNQLYGRTASTDERAYSTSNNYNALQTNLSRRLVNGIYFQANYTWSKNMQYGQTEYFHQLYGPSTFDRTNVFKLSHLIELPFGKGKHWLTSGLASKITGGWQVNGILTLASGLPVTISASATPCDCPGNSQTADAISPVHYLNGIGPGQLWFTTSSFAAPAANRFGTAGIGTVRGPGLKDYDMSIFRRFAVRERLNLELRGEAFNLTNTPNFSTPDASVNDGTFGQILSTLNGAGQRQLQLAARITF